MRKAQSQFDLRPGQRRLQRGVSLVEALVALAVMSFGMLALVGVQATMRFNSDVARQRTEATRIASEDLEKTRLFTTLTPDANQTRPSWQELVATPEPLTVALPGDTGNATFVLTRTVALRSDLEAPDARVSAASMKVVQAEVQWTDRTGAAVQDATLNTIVTRVSPVLSAALSLPAVGSATNQQSGRHVSIPVLAKDLGNGKSAFKPFDQNNVVNTVWVLNNTTGYVTSVCTGVVASQNAITAGDLTSCETVNGRLVTGKVRFDMGLSGMDATVSERPGGPVLPLDPNAPLAFSTAVDNPPVDQIRQASCRADLPASADAAAQRPASQRSEIAYACLVFPSAATGWGGKLEVRNGVYPEGIAGEWAIGTLPTSFRVCRYTLANTQYTRNADHPKTYCKVASELCSSRVTQNLSNQNFLVIPASFSCPTDDWSDGGLVNSNTLPHQP